MGRPKAALLLGGKTFLERVVAACKPVFAEVVVVIRGERPDVVDVRVLLEAAHEPVAPLFGLAEALQHDPGPRAWVVAVDYPMITSEVLSYLSARFDSSQADLLVPRSEGKLQMLCAGYATSLLPAMRRKIEVGEYQLRSLVEPHRTIIVEEDEVRSRFGETVLMNVNTPEDYAKVRMMVEVL